MLVTDLKHILKFAKDDDRITILETKSYATIGGTPTVDVKSVLAGFDWDNGKLMFVPNEPLVKQISTDEQVAKDLQTKIGWLNYENRNLKAEIRKLKKELENATKTN